MRKIITYVRYFYDFVKYREFSFIFATIAYAIMKRPARKNRIVQTGLGKFVSRKGTIDFLFANYAYEWNVKSILLKNYKDYDVFLDIGANIGTYSILFGKKGMKCFAFEAVTENFSTFEENLKLNNLLGKVNCFNFGLGHKEFTADFLFNPINTGASHIKNAKPMQRGIPSKAEIKPLDSVFEGFGLQKEDKILMKIDVEGMEAEVLQGARKFISTFANILIIMESSHSEMKNIEKELTHAGFQKYWSVDKYNIAAKKLNTK
jgi:FkbM family methyltransferase